MKLLITRFSTQSRFYQFKAELRGSSFEIFHNPCTIPLLIIILARINILRASIHLSFLKVWHLGQCRFLQEL